MLLFLRGLRTSHPGGKAKARFHKNQILFSEKSIKWELPRNEMIMEM